MSDLSLIESAGSRPSSLIPAQLLLVVGRRAGALGLLVVRAGELAQIGEGVIVPAEASGALPLVELSGVAGCGGRAGLRVRLLARRLVGREATERRRAQPLPENRAASSRRRNSDCSCRSILSPGS